jgi:hypothetical protein
MFFQLTHPDYETDLDHDHRNPVSIRTRYRVPGIKCPVCGPRSSGSRLRVPVPDDPHEFLGIMFLELADWNAARGRWSARLGVDAESVLPGAAIGAAEGVCSRPIDEDAVHPFPGQIWVGERARQGITAAGFSGVAFAEVHLEGCASVVLSELVASGRASSVAPGGTLLCEICGRRSAGIFGAPIDEGSWDGSDFFHVDGNPNAIWISQRVAAFFRSETGRFSNIECVPLGSR